MKTEEQRQNEEAQRGLVIRIATLWLRTPYHHNQCVRGLAADCAGFPLEVYKGAALIPQVELPYYSHQWHLNREEELYIKFVTEVCGAREIPEEEVKPADFVMYQVGRCFGHGAIVISWPDRIIHAVERLGVIYSHGTDEGLTYRRRRRFFTIW